MNRRNFLKHSGLLAAALVIRPGLSQSNLLTTGKTAYRGDAAGNIYSSSDAGQTWQVHMRLGPHCAVQALSQDRARNVYADVTCAGYRFRLVLAKDGRYWKTV